MRDWHAISQLTVLPLAATLLLHGLIAGFLLLRWQADRELRTIEAQVLPPSIIKATLIDASSLREEKKPRARPVPKAPAPKPQPRRETPAASTPKAGGGDAGSSAPARDRGNTSAGKPEASKPKQATPAEDARRITANELAAISRRELAAAVASEEAERVAVTAQEMAASYAALIRETVSGYWSTPPSARNGMQVLLELQLVPTGEVVSVRILESSGDQAFDRSATNAVEKAGSFPELKNLPAREFEKNFRRFRLLFRPEDLRY